MKHTKGPWSKDYNGTIGHIKTLCDPEKHTKTVIKYRYNLCEEILTEDEIEANARLISCAPEMMEALIENYTTYEVLKEIFEKQNPNLWGMIQGSFLNTPEKTKDIIEKATGLKIEEVIK